jgi:hypothetical protein
MLLHETWKMSTGVLKTEEHRLNGGGVGSTHRINKNVTRNGLQTMERKLECTMNKQPHQKTPLVNKKAELTADRGMGAKS